MPKYIYIFRGVDADKEGLSPAEIEEVMGRWSAWAGTFAARDAMLGGQRLETAGRVVGNGGVVTDGPFAESKEYVGGFFIVECADLAEAAELAKDCPGLASKGSTVEVRQVSE